MAIGRLPISAYCLVKRVTAKTQYGSCREDDRERERGRGIEIEIEIARGRVRVRVIEKCVHTESERKGGHRA